jgi:hypothetical protein
MAVPDRAYLAVTGSDASKFLQGICTNDVTAKLVHHGDVIAAAFLTTKGRILADALLYNVVVDAADGAKRTVVIETHVSAADALTKYLSLYRLRSRVKVSDATAVYKTVVHTDSAEAAATAGGSPCVVAAADPRSPALGTRCLMHRNSSNSSSSSGGSDSAGDGGVDLYTRWRLLHGVAEGPEIVNRIPLECNLDLLHYIDFAKGCYVGQELIARTKFKGLVRKRLLPFVARPFLKELGLAGSTGPDGFTAMTAPERAAVFAASSMAAGSGSSGSGHVVAGMRVVDDQVASSSSKSSSSSSSSSGAAEEAGDGGNDSVGEVVGVDGSGRVGVALVRLAQTLPSPADAADAVPAGPTAALRAGTEAIPLRVFRPPWWIDKDPLTGNRIDTYEPPGLSS